MTATFGRLPALELAAMQTCYDCGSQARLNSNHRCESCARAHAIQIHMLKIHLAGDLDWFGALEEPALDS